jgi:hypothetical protein
MKLLTITEGCVKFSFRFSCYVKFDCRTKGYVKFHLEACTQSKLSGHQTQILTLICNYYGTT